MKVLRPAAIQGLTRRGLLRWSNADGDSAFEFAIASTNASPFACFFLVADPKDAAPKISFDQGEGFNELSAITFLAFPFAFYHVSLATMGAVGRIVFALAASRRAFALWQCVPATHFSSRSSIISSTCAIKR